MSEHIWLPDQPNRPNDEPSLIGIFVPVSVVFPDIHPTVEALIEQLAMLSRTDALLWCARLNLVISNSTHQDNLAKQKFGIKQFLRRDQVEAIAEFIDQHGPPDRVSVFFRHQILELMQWIAMHCTDRVDDGVTFENEAVRQAFACALLIAGELWGEETYAGKLTTDFPGTTDELMKRSLGAMRVGTDAASVGLDPLLAIARGRMLFCDHLQQVRPSFPHEFEEATDLSIDSFYNVLTMIAVNYLVRSPSEGGPTKANSGIFSRDEFCSASADCDRSFLAYRRSFCQSVDDFSTHIKTVFQRRGGSPSTLGLQEIRKKPLLETDDGRCITLDPVYFAEHAAVGPLFAVAGSITNRARSNECFRDFGFAFEQYCSATLRTMYPKPPHPLFDA